MSGTRILTHVCYNRAPVKVREYLERININATDISSTVGAAESIETLTHLQKQHLLSVPFENLDIHQGVPIVLDQPAILDKIVRRRRGGFCYELNTAFAWLLRELGFDVTFLSAEVARPGGEFDLPFGHMALRVDIDGRSWLADVGFGECFIQPSPSPSRPARRSAQLPSYASRKDLAFGKRRRGDIPIHPRAVLPCRFRASLPSPPDVIRIPLYSESRYDARHAQRTRNPDSRAMHRPRERQA